MATRRPPTGGALLQAGVTASIGSAVLEELTEHGYARLTMEAVARRAGVGKSALYRRWPSKLDMVLEVAGGLSVPALEPEDTGSLLSDVRAVLDATLAWLTRPPLSTVVPDLVAETARSPDLAPALEAWIGRPRRERARAVFDRAVARGEVAEDTDVELALDLLAAPLYWRLVARHAAADSDYLDRLARLIVGHVQ